MFLLWVLLVRSLSPTTLYVLRARSHLAIAPTTPGGPTLAHLRAQLLNATSSPDPDPDASLHPHSFASTLSALLSAPLALPVQPAGQEPFPEEEVRAWAQGSEELWRKVERGAGKCARLWCDVLEWVPPPAAAAPASGEGPTPTPTRAEFLRAVRQELDLVADRKPTEQVYAREGPPDEEGWRAVEEEEERARAERERETEARFERWLEEVMGSGSDAAAAAAAAPAKDGEGGPLAPSAVERRRAMLDVPLSGPGGTGPTWRDQLRVQWATMFDPTQGGVLGNIEREMRNLASSFDLPGGEEDGTEEWRPKPPQIMAAHHLRAQLLAELRAVQDAARSDRRPHFGPAPESDDARWEEATFPASLEGIPDAYLSLEQLAIQVDRRARAWAGRTLALFFPSSRSDSSAPASAPFSARKRTALLRSSPFVPFLRALDTTFSAPRDPAHFRIGVSPHDLANAIFGLSTPAMAPRARAAGAKGLGEGEGEGGCSALQVEKLRRAVRRAEAALAGAGEGAETDSELQDSRVKEEL